MNGRLEGEEKIKKATEKLLEGLPEYVNEWSLKLRASYKTESTIRNYVTKLKHFLEFISPDVKNVKPEDITENNTMEFFIGLKTKERNNDELETSYSWRITYWYCMNNFIEFMVNRRYMVYNYMDSIDKPKNKDRERINKNRVFLNADDFNNILRIIDTGAGSHRARARQQKWKERDKAIFLLFVTTGMRKTALSQINIEDVDFDNDRVVIRDKGDYTHEYPLPKTTIDALKRWIVKRNNYDIDSDALFISNRFNRMSGEAIEDLVEKYSLEGLGFSISPHKLRAGYISIIQNTYNDIYRTMKVAGHRNIETTKIYITTDNKEREQAADVMEKLLTA